MHEPKASLVYYATGETVIAPSECTILKHAVPRKCVINVLFLVTLTFSQADVLKLTAVSVHTLLFLTALVW